MKQSNEAASGVDFRDSDTVELLRPSGGHRRASRGRLVLRARHGAARAREMARRAVLAVSGRWDSLWPVLLGILIGSSVGIAFWLMLLVWWLNT